MHELTQDQIDEFQDRGYLRVPQQVPEEVCLGLRDQIWHRLEKRGFARDQPETWIEAYGNNPRLKDIRRLKALGELYTEDVRQMGFQLLGSQGEHNDRQLLLLTFPDKVTGYTQSPAGFTAQAWHTDCPRVPNVNAPGIIVLSYLDDVEASGGGTVIVAGSHRICTSKDHPIRSKQLKRYLRRSELGKTIFEKATNQTLDVRGISETFDDVLLEVVELSGKAGDVIFVDGRTLHSIASNRNAKPRLVSRGFFHSRELLEHYQIRI